MLINLKTCAAHRAPQIEKIELNTRLPSHIVPPCLVNCQFDVKAYADYYLMSLHVESMLVLICQRCLGEFTYHYTNQTVLAICKSDEIAAKMMGQFECIAADSNQIDLVELLTDELHLYTPQFHPLAEDCNGSKRSPSS